MKSVFSIHRRVCAAFVSVCVVLSGLTVTASAAQAETGTPVLSSAAIPVGGSAGCIRYNPDNHRAYVLDGQDGKIAVKHPSESDGRTVWADDPSIDLKSLYAKVPGLASGRATSLAVDTLRDVLALSVKSADDTQNGAIILTDYSGNFIRSFPAGVQPDGIFVSPDQEYVLTADKGHAAGGTDPKGSVTVLDLSLGIGAAASKVVTFDNYTGKGAELSESSVILQNGADPSRDLEPVSLCIAGSRAYVTCEKNNAIATLDLTRGVFTEITGLGYKNYGEENVDVLTPKAPGGSAYCDSGRFSKLWGAYMPNGIAAFTAPGGKTYLVTANEGADDSLRNADGTVEVPADKLGTFTRGDNGSPLLLKDSDYDSVECLDTSRYSGEFPSGSILLGARSITLWDADTMRKVADTDGQIEEKLRQFAPGHYNLSTEADAQPDVQSCKNGPAPDSVAVGTSPDGTPRAYVGLRAGGMAVFDLSDTGSPDFSGFADTRTDNGKACCSESLAAVQAKDSPAGSTVLLQTDGAGGQIHAVTMDDADTSLLSGRAVDIFCTNDMHGSLVTVHGNSGAVQTIGSDFVAGLKRGDPGSLLIDAGDATQGSSLATLTKGADVIRLMNAAGYDAMACGNHEFDYGQDQLLQNAKAAEFPILSANSIKNGNPFFKGVPYLCNSETSNGSYLIKYAAGLKIGILGITTPETAYKTNPNGTTGIDFGQNDLSAFSKTVQDSIDAMKKAEKPDIVIGVMHLGDDPSSIVTAEGVVRETSGLNLLIDGHSHQVECESVQDRSGHPVPLVQTGSSGRQVDKVTLHCSFGQTGLSVTCNTDRDVTAYTGANIAGSTSPVAPITQLAADIVASQADRLKPVVGTSKTPLWGGTINGINEARLSETNLGCLVADAMTWKAKQLVPLTHPAYRDLPIVALQNGGGVRATVKAGNITVGDVLNVLPFGNTIAFKVVTPAQLYAIVENGVSKVVSQNASTGQISGADGRFPQISGFSFTYDPRKPAGSRVTSLSLDNHTSLNRTDSSGKLILASNDYEIAGGDGYGILKGLPSAGEGSGLDTVLEDYIQNLGGTVSPPIFSKRITCAGGYVPKPYTASVRVEQNGVPVTANTAVSYSVDGSGFQDATAGEGGIVSLPNLPDGPHAVQVGDADAVLVNNYSGAGVTTAVAAQVKAAAWIPPQNSGHRSNGHSGDNSQTGQGISPAGQIPVIKGPDGKSRASVALQPDTPPSVWNGVSHIVTTVPSGITAVLSAATAQNPVQITLTAPTAALLAQLQAPGVSSIGLTIQAPPSALNSSTAAKVSIFLEPAVLQAAKSAQKGIAVTVKNGSDGTTAYSWDFSGKALQASPASVVGVDLAVTAVSLKDDPAAAAAVRASGGDAAGKVLQLPNNGLLPAPAALTVSSGMQKNPVSGAKVYLYFFDRNLGVLEQIGNGFSVEAGGSVTFPIVHCSDYVLLSQPPAKPYPFRCDTTYPTAVKKGKSYTFAVTANGTVMPTLSVGNAKAFAGTVKRQGKKYYITVRAIGVSGTMTGIYCALPKQKPVILDYIKIV